VSDVEDASNVVDPPASPPVVGADELAGMARRLIAQRGRSIIGISGPPGSGKSTIAASLCAEIGPDAVLVPADGFHLSDQLLAERGWRDRKGAPETFDVDGFLSLLQRIRAAEAEVVYAPRFDRSLEAAIVGCIAVARQTPLVIVEGNYLLADIGPWAATRQYLDARWYIDVDDDVRRQRLIRRHERHGRTLEEATRWALGNDETNAQLIERTSAGANLVIRGD
jgi:pantothenate kinase